MRICFVTYGDFFGHATLKRATGMAEPLVERGHEVTILLHDTETNRRKAELECPRAAIRWIPANVSFPRELRLKQKHVNELRPDIVWICGVGPRNWMRRSHEGCTVLADHSELYSVVENSFLKRAMYRILEWGYCLAFDGQICASRYLENHYRRRLDRIGIKRPLLYSPYAFKPELAGIAGKGDDSQGHDCDDRDRVFYLGSFRTRYGFWDMLEAWKILSARRPGAVLEMVGRGPEEARGRNWVRNNGLEDSILIAGYVPDDELDEHLATADAFLCPLRETIQDVARCPSKLYLYLPYKKPVITCKIGEAAEIFGEDGYYYRSGDPNSMADMIEAALDRTGPCPSVNPAEHTYAHRTEAFLQWYGNSFK